MQISPELGARPEIGLTDTEFASFLNGVGNLVPKLVTAAVFLSEPDRWFSTSELGRALNTSQGETPRWPINRSVVSGYSTTLESIGMVVESTKPGQRGHDVAAFKAINTKPEAYLALIDAELHWAQQHPELPLSFVWGSSVSVNEDIRSPEVRYSIYTDILTRTSNRQSARQIKHSIGVDYASDESVARQLQLMRDREIITLNTKTTFYDPDVMILDTAYTSVVKSLAETSRETQAIYKIISELGADTVLKLSELIAKASQADPAIDTDLARISIICGAGNGPGFPGLFIDTDGEISTVALAPRHQKAIEELVYALDEARQPSHIPHYAMRAKRLLQQPAVIASLFEQAREDSLYAQSEEVPLREVVLAQVQQMGGLTARQTMERVAAVDGRIRGLDNTRQILNRYVLGGVLEVEEIPSRPYGKRLVKRYKPINT